MWRRLLPLALMALALPASAQVTGSIEITVEAPPPPPPADLIWDGPTTGVVGDTLRITYTVVDSTGAPTPGVTTWAVSDGNKATLLEFTDSTVAVVLLSPGAVRLNYSVATPGGGPDPLPPPDGGDWSTDPPPGYALISRNDFEDALFAPGWDGRVDNPEGTQHLRRVPATEPTGDWVARFTYDAGYIGGDGTAHLNYLERMDAPSIFVRAWIRLSDGWQWNGSGVNKFGYLQLWDGPCSNARPWILNLEGNRDPGRVGFVGQCDRDLISRYATSDVDGLHRGRWVEVAWQVVGATDDTGALLAWVGADLGLDVARQTVPAGHTRISGFHGAPVWGGTVGEIVTPQWLDIGVIELWAPGS